MKSVNKLIVTYHSRSVGTLSMTPDNRLCAFQYDREWLANGFSISPLDLPLKPDLFIAKPQPFWGNFGILKTVSLMDMGVIYFIVYSKTRGE